jgi:hypothetical protein
MRHYCGIDLHGNNSFIAIIDETDWVMFEKRLPNDLLEFPNEAQRFGGRVA